MSFCIKKALYYLLVSLIVTGNVAVNAYENPTGMTEEPYSQPTNVPVATLTGPIQILKSIDGEKGVYVDNATSTVLSRDGDILYTGGIFTKVQLAGQKEVSRFRLAAINTRSKTVLEWNPAPDEKVETIVSDAKRVYVGGQFTQIENGDNRYLVAFDKPSLQLNSWVPNPDAPVYALHVDPNSVYVGGNFLQIAGVNREKLAVFDAENLNVTNWLASINGAIYTMQGNETTLFVGGEFTQINGQSRTYLAAFNKKSGSLLSWAPQTSHPVRSMTLGDDAVIVKTSSGSTERDAKPIQTAYSTTTGIIVTLTPQPKMNPSTVEPNTVNPSTVALTGEVKINLAQLGFQIPNLSQLLTFIVRMFFVVGGLVALFYLLIGAFEWITSGGDEEKIGTARKKIIAAIIGVLLIVAVLSVVGALETFVFRKQLCFGLTCSATIPSLIEPL